MSRNSAFMSGALTGAAIAVADQVSLARIWHWLCVIFLPGWLFLLSSFTVGITGSGEFIVWGWVSLLLSALVTVFLINSAAKIAAPGNVTNGGVRHYVISNIRHGSWGRKITFLLPALFLVLAAIGFAGFASILGSAASIAIGVHVGKVYKREGLAAEVLGHRLGASLGGTLLPGSLFYGNEPGTFGVHPLPPAALALINNVDELRNRIDEFAPEWEVRFLDTETLIVGPRTYPTQTSAAASAE